ncbi:MAG: replication-relaxation family protein, partial [Acidimicrobiales bacterium]
MDGSRGGGSSADRLSPVDHELLSHLVIHRVLTTPQLITLVRRPERTVDYRLSRLRANGVVDRTRPYAASGSAPFFWWLTRQGARLVEGTSPAPGKSQPNPLFLRHTSAIAGLYVASVDIGPAIGLTDVSWRRDELAWEEWSPRFGATKHLRPDAHLEVTLEVDGSPGRAGVFIEVDFATMDQRRLRAKVLRHRDYAEDLAWQNRHPGAPALLLVTTSEARVSHFLANAERDRPAPSLYAKEHLISWDPLVAACASVTAPEEALSAPVWRTSVPDAPTTLVSLLAPEVRKYRRLMANVRAQQQAKEHRHQVLGIKVLLDDSQAIAEAMEDPVARAAVHFVFEQELQRGFSLQEEWSERHLKLVVATHAWWVEQDGRS